MSSQIFKRLNLRGFQVGKQIPRLMDYKAVGIRFQFTSSNSGWSALIVEDPKEIKVLDEQEIERRMPCAAHWKRANEKR